MADFVPGQRLSREFYEAVIAPRVGVPHAAALLGAGSDVLGYDTERSTDHDWGPRCTLFVSPSAVADVRTRVVAALPEHYQGWPVAIGRDGHVPKPNVIVASLTSWLSAQLGWPVADPVGGVALTATDWLLLPQQRLLEITAGAVFADHDGQLRRLRDRFAWYPDPVWWWLLACQWRRLAQEEPFVSRTAEVGDDLGSRVVCGRLVRECMRLALLIARRYAPYAKWLGTAFARLPDGDGLGNHLRRALAADMVAEREAALGQSYECLAHRFNTLAPSTPLDTSLRDFFDRPARVLGADRFATAALARISDPALAAMPLVGSVDSMLDSADVLTTPERTAALRPFYTAFLPPIRGETPGDR